MIREIHAIINVFFKVLGGKRNYHPELTSLSLFLFLSKAQNFQRPLGVRVWQAGGMKMLVESFPLYFQQVESDR